MFGDILVNGIPLIFLVFGLVEAVKKFIPKLGGVAAQALSLALGLILFFGYSYSINGLPADFSGWFSVVLTGLAFGLTASGLYDFSKKFQA